jgi:hypothetical protein
MNVYGPHPRCVVEELLPKLENCRDPAFQTVVADMTA